MKGGLLYNYSVLLSHNVHYGTYYGTEAWAKSL